MKKKPVLPVVLFLALCCLGMGAAIYYSAREAFNPKISSIPTANPDTPEILASSELPVDLQQRTIPWFSGALDLHTGQRVDPVLSSVSDTDRFQIYVDSSDRIKMRDLKTGDEKVLASAEEYFPRANIENSAIVFSPDGKYVFFLVDWRLDQVIDINLGNQQVFHRNYIVAVARLNVSDGKIAILNLDPRFSGNILRISSTGEMIMQCSYMRGGDLSSELCLLDSMGNFLRYLTFDRGYPGSIRAEFTPDGKWVIYTNSVTPGIYRVSVEGNRRQKISDCGMPVLATNEHVVVQCPLSFEPECYGLFLVNLDGSDFRRIGYIEPYCAQDKIP